MMRVTATEGICIPIRVVDIPEYRPRSDLAQSKSDVFVRQILTSEVDPRTEIVKHL